MLEDMLIFMGVEKPFNMETDGSITTEGADALSKAVRIVRYFEQMGLITINCRDLEEACDEIVDLGY